MILEIKNLSKRYGDFLAVDNVNLSIKKGEILGLLGPNGAGKTTIINCIIGLNKIDAGSIEVFGKDIIKHELIIKKHIGIVTQNIAVHYELTAYDNLMYFGSIYGLRGGLLKQYVEEALEFVELSQAKKKFPEEFSGGMLRRLNIACGIVHKPKLIIMDEPTTSIDPKSRNHILDGIEALAKSGVTIIYTSHYMEEIERLCSNIAILNHGKIIAYGNKEELKNMVSSEERVKLEVSSINYNIVDNINKIYGVKECNIYENKLQVISEKQSKNLGKIIDSLVGAGLDIVDINIEKPNIEDVFLTLTGKNLRD